MNYEEQREFLEKLGIEKDAGCRFEVAELLKQHFGTDYLLNELINSLSDDEALEHFEHIHRMNQ